MQQKIAINQYISQNCGEIREGGFQQSREATTDPVLSDMVCYINVFNVFNMTDSSAHKGTCHIAR